MITPKDAKSLIAGEEGRANRAYPDSRGISTNGIGHKDASMPLGTYWPDARVEATFEADYAAAAAGISRAFPAFARLDGVRQAYLVSMAFQLGVTGTLGFHKALAAAADGRWSDFAAEVLASDWHTQTPARCERAARAFKTGMWQMIP